jgi:hypothetical protein
MNHTGHVVGGMIAGGAVCFLASTTGDVELGLETLNEMAKSHCRQLRTLRRFLVCF